LNEKIIEKSDEFCRAELKKALLFAIYKKFSEIDGLSINGETYKAFTDKIYLDTAAVSGQNILWNTCETLSFGNAPSRARMKPTANTVWFAKIKNSPKYLLVKDYMTDYLESLVLSTGFMGIKAKPELTGIYYYYFSGDEFYKLQGAVCNGVTMEGLSNSLLQALDIPEFAPATVAEFNKQCEVLIRNNYNMRQGNKALQKHKTAYLKNYFG
jgi:type I restriction enzyme S subunit